MEIPSGYAQVNHVIGGSAFPRGAQNVFGILHSTAPVAFAPNDLAQKAKDLYEAHFRPRTIGNCILNEVRVKYGPNTTGPDGSATGPITGAIGSEGDPPSVAILVRKVTALGGRTGRGRMFIPGAPESDTGAGGRLTLSALGFWQAAVTDWLNAWNAAGIPLVLLHGTPGLAPFVVSRLEVQPLVATQRRRLRKVGGRRTAAPLA